MTAPLDEIIIGARLAMEHKVEYTVSADWTALPNDELEALCLAAREWSDVCETARDPRYSLEAIGIQIRNVINAQLAKG